MFGGFAWDLVGLGCFFGVCLFWCFLDVFLFFHWVFWYLGGFGLMFAAWCLGGP